MKQYWLLTPGPVNTSQRVRNAALGPDLCHREPEYTTLMQRVRGKLLQVASVPSGEYKSVLVAGSGTAAVELAIASIVRPGRKLLVVRNGVYGDRIANMADAHKIDRVEVTAPWTARPPIEAIEQALRSDPAIDAVALVHHETTTGLLNPVLQVGELCRRYDKIFALDSVSGFAGEELNIQESGVDLMACTANKCLHGLPGVAFVIVSGRAEKHVREVPRRSVYFDLQNYLVQQEQGNVPFTPGVTGTYTLDAALDELLAEGGVAQRIATYRSRSLRIRTGLQTLGIALYLEEPLLSNTITAFRLPNGLAYETLHDRLKEKGFVIYAGQGNLSREIFRVANIGHVPMHVYDEFLDAMKTTLA